MASSINVRSSTLPTVVILGRPNVGKSTLFNRLFGARVAIVHDQPGATRDRLYRPVTWNGRTFLLTDTGGFFGPDDDPFSPGVQDQIEVAASIADVLCMVVDGKDGPTPLDHETADRVRRLRVKAGKIPVILAVNKWDNPSEDYVSEYYTFGFDEIMPVSATHGHGTGSLLDAIVDSLPEHAATPEEINAPAIAIVGRPNAGKSTLLNTLSGQERSLVSPIPGTTRDPVDTLIEWEGRVYRLVDTAGVRRRAKMSEGIDRYSLARCKAAVARSDVALLLIDATQGPTETDAKVFSLAHDLGRAAILLVNKWDTVEKDNSTAGATVKQIREAMPFLRYAEVQLVSALTGQRLQRILPCVDKAIEQHRRRIPTAALNQLLERILKKTPPPSRHGRMSKIYYWTQADSAPPTFILFCNDPLRIHFSYQRFLINQLYEAFGFEGTPLRLFLRRRTSRIAERDQKRSQEKIDAEKHDESAVEESE